MGQFLLGDTGHSLEVIMAGVAEVCGAKAEENSHRAAVPAFILQEVCAMLGAHLVKSKQESSGVGLYFCEKTTDKQHFKEQSMLFDSRFIFRIQTECHLTLSKKEHQCSS